MPLTVAQQRNGVAAAPLVGSRLKGKAWCKQEGDSSKGTNTNSSPDSLTMQTITKKKNDEL